MKSGSAAQSEVSYREVGQGAEFMWCKNMTHHKPAMGWMLFWLLFRLNNILNIMGISSQPVKVGWFYGKFRFAFHWRIRRSDITRLKFSSRVNCSLLFALLIKRLNFSCHILLHLYCHVLLQKERLFLLQIPYQKRENK